MKPKKRQKLCHNCEGDIDVDVIVCPFCAADLREEKPEQRYSNSYVSTTINHKAAVHEEVVEEAPHKTLEEKKVGVLMPTLLFTIGAQVAVLGLLMLLFSHNGEVILKWDARFWFFYLFASVPFLVFGYKTLTKIN